MDTAVQIFCGFLALAALAFMLFCLAKHHQNKNFHRFMKPGDWCKWMNDIMDDRWQIQYLVGNRAIIWNPMTEEVEVANVDDLFV